jgi:hypothetical protein
VSDLLIVGATVAVYFLPTIVALLRQHRNAAPIFILNWLGGWTVIGWVAALVWSMTYQEKGAI